MQDATGDCSPGSSSAKTLSSGLRSAVRQLGSSYRLGSSAARDFPIRALSPCGPGKRHAAQRLGAIRGSKSCASPKQQTSSKQEVYELSSSDGMHLHQRGESHHICPLRMWIYLHVLVLPQYAPLIWFNPTEPHSAPPDTWLTGIPCIHIPQNREQHAVGCCRHGAVLVQRQARRGALSGSFKGKSGPLTLLGSMRVPPS